MFVGAAAVDEDESVGNEEDIDADVEAEGVAFEAGARCHDGRIGAVVGNAGNWFLNWTRKIDLTVNSRNMLFAFLRLNPDNYYQYVVEYI